WIETVIAYLEGLARPEGGYAWDNLGRAHLTPTFGAIGCYRLLDRDPPGRAKLAEFVRTHHPARLKKLEQEHHVYEYQQIQALLWLGADVSEFAEVVRSWKRPTRYLRQYEQDSNPIFRFELTAFTCRSLLGLPLDDLTAEFTSYLDARR